MRTKQPQLTNCRPLVIAHRGASAEKPENSLAAFRRALALGVDAIELDVRVTRDGTAVVFHDENLRRLTGTDGTVAAKSARALAHLRIGGTGRIPRLVDVLRLTRGRATVQIEIKGGVPVGPVVRAVKAARATANVILASFAIGLLRDARRLAPAVPRMLITDGRLSRPTLARQLTAVGAGGLSVDHRAVRTAAWVNYFHARGWVVWAWTVNESRAMRRLAGWGVDGILSDNPALLQRTV
jgi:glycerophosphoryl diester phosphodiesterase